VGFATRKREADEPADELHLQHLVHDLSNERRHLVRIAELSPTIEEDAAVAQVAHHGRAR